MSAESMQWLNENVKVGYTSKRGTAWHYDGTTNNHYAMEVPVQDVLDDLFNWQPEVIPVANLVGPSGTVYTDPKRVMIGRPDTGAIFGAVTTGYRIHDYASWLLDNVSLILDADLKISSAGLLRGGAQAWVQIEMEETLSHAGYDFRPFLVGTTSLDGSCSTTYRDGVTAVVCDNTLAAFMSGKANEFKVRHSANSLGRLAEARDALKIIHTTGDDFMAELETLTAEKITRKRFLSWADAYAEVQSEKDSKSRAGNFAERKRDQLVNLYDDDERVSPWKGTAFGVVQAANTWTHWFARTRNQSVAERNFSFMVRGDAAEVDSKALAVLRRV